MTKILRLPLRALRTRITLLEAQDVPDVLGGVTRQWVSGAQRWAYVVPQPVARIRGSVPVSNNGRLRLVLRRQAQIPPKRLVWHGHTYAVLQSHDVPEQDMQQWICERI